jgi:hypothetical protein
MLANIVGKFLAYNGWRFAMNITVKKLVKALVPYGLLYFYQRIKQNKNQHGFVWLMTEKEQKLFKQYVRNAKVYFEFGSGGSTIAALSNSAGKVYSIESSKEWIKSMEQKYEIIMGSEKSGRLSLIHADIGDTGNSGYPIISCDEDDFNRFFNYYQKVFKDYSEIKNADVVLIDGRFRVACCLSVLLENDNNPIIMFHDFWNRPQYHVVKKFIDIIDRTDSIMVCKKRVDISKDEIVNVIDNYKYVSE